ncbi:unnamed protein product [Pieris macdunnoughi]|uniref:Uncharacterized protein n=1 Tax=Pieris macdunnoughi TaxID=345717 RepID=A0A821WEY4_9NEOP|nr:unnamed protein product [Pieris macdunnoughi]
MTPNYLGIAPCPVSGKFEPHPAAGFNMGYLMAPYPYPNGGAHPLPVSMDLQDMVITNWKEKEVMSGSSCSTSLSA